MAVLDSLRTPPVLVRERPVLFLPLAMVARLHLPQDFLGTIDPVLSRVVPGIDGTIAASEADGTHITDRWS